MPKLYYQNQSISFDLIPADPGNSLGEGMQKVLSIINDWQKGTDLFPINTSGSTGTPKTIQLKRNLIEYSAHLTGHSFGLAEGDNLLCCLSMDYIAGMMMVFRALVLKCNLTVTPVSSNPLDELSIDLHPDFASFVPMQLQAILEKTDPKQIELLNNMKAILVGGGPVSQTLAEKIKLLQVPVYHTYSMTETYTHVATRLLNGDKASDIYYPLKEVSLGTDERDCLTITSPITEGKTLITNDIVEFQADGGFIWLGRYDNVINSGGLKIQLEESEESIRTLLVQKGYQIPLMAGALPDEKLGHRLILILENTSPDKWLKDDLLTYLSQNMARHKAPKEVYFVKKLAYTHTGKIDRKASLASITKN